MGGLAIYFEEEGLATTQISLIRIHTERTRPPRALWVPYELGRPIGVPKTGIFGLIDLVGLDLMPHVAKSMSETLPKGDAFHGIYKTQPLIDRMIAEGSIGRKGRSTGR